MSEHQHNFKIVQADLRYVYEKCECGERRTFQHTAPPLTKEQAQVLVTYFFVHGARDYLQTLVRDGNQIADEEAVLVACRSLIAIAEQ